jgi:hypothetical protein
VSTSFLNPASLPGPLPADEKILWQGRPDWRALTLRVFHVRGIGIYFCVLALWRAASGWVYGDTGVTVALSVAWMATLGVITLGVLTSVALLVSRTTQYTITSQRIVFQFGVALPMTVNIPFRIIGSAALKTYRDGTGDIPMTITGKDRIAYLVLWPHARPWRLARVEPMLRNVSDAARVSEIFARALISANRADAPAQSLAEIADAAPRTGAAVGRQPVGAAA